VVNGGRDPAVHAVSRGRSNLYQAADGQKSIWLS
jgi:hypothetical protein